MNGELAQGRKSKVEGLSNSSPGVESKDKPRGHEVSKYHEGLIMIVSRTLVSSRLRGKTIVYCILLILNSSVTVK